MNASTEHPAAPEGYRFVDLDSVDSTNAEARRRADSGERGPIVIRARRQTAGRGRKGREWHSPEGNLYISILLSEAIEGSSAGQLSFVAAVAVAEAVAEQSPPAIAALLRCKWPNDILLDGRKLGGILVETAFEGGDLTRWAVVGIGVNLASHPDGARWPAVNLAAYGVHWPAPDAARAIAAAFERWFRRWTAEGFEPVRAAWTARGFRIGEAVVLVTGDGRMEGASAGIGDDGALLFRRSGAADVIPVYNGEIVRPDDSGRTH